MATFETIVRPYVPPSVGPGTIQSKCQRPPDNTTVKFSAKATTTADLRLVNNQRPGKGPSAKVSGGNKKGKTYNSSWSYGYKCYMTKKEKEQEKCDEDRVVGSGQSYETNAAGQAVDSGGGGDSGSGPDHSTSAPTQITPGGSSGGQMMGGS